MRVEKQRGGALLTVIVLSTVIALILGASASVAVSHYQRTTRESDYTAAIQAADAGVNYQLNRISQDPSDTTKPCQADTPCSGSIAGTGATYTVYITNEDGSSPWAAPNAGILRSVGAFNGVAREVLVRGAKKSIFDEYAIFTVYSEASPNSLTFNGTGSVINGSVGTNGGTTANASVQVNGNLTLLGPNATGTSGANVYTEPTAMEWPTVDEIANAAFLGGGLAWLRTHNNNGNLKQFAAGDTNLDNAISANFPISGPNMYKLRDPDFVSLNDGPAGLVWDDSMEAIDSSLTMTGKKVMIFPPGDYYFEDIAVSSTDACVMIDNRNGPVRIWVNTASTGPVNNDTISANFFYADPAPSKFRLYYNKCATITVAGNTTFNGGFYAWKEGCDTNKLPSYNFTGGSTINGSVIGGAITVAGGTVVNFPSDGSGAGADDFSLWYGFNHNWKEVAISGAASVFADGTSK